MAFWVSLRDLHLLSFLMRKDILYESVKKFVKTRKEDLNAYFTASLRALKFIISCCGLLFYIYRNKSAPCAILVMWKS